MCNDSDYLYYNCGCEEAQKCCEGKTLDPTVSPPEGSVVCEGYDEFQYCDCSQYMCTEEYYKNGRCGCEEAQKCCEGFTSWPTWAWIDEEEGDALGDEIKVKRLR